MKRRYKVIWSDVAEEDLRNVTEYITADSPSNALEILNSIKQKASNLYDFPERGRIVPELRDQGVLLYREIIVSQWRVIYRISEDIVYILSLLDSPRNIEDILLGRLLRLKM